jgi:hypothetical protein
MKTSVPAEQSEFLILWVDFQKKTSVSAEPRSKRRVLDSRERKKSNAARVLTTELAARVEEDVSPTFS